MIADSIKEPGPDLVVKLSQQVSVACIWVTYFFRSIRVKHTFIR